MNSKIIAILSIVHLCIDITGSALPAIMPFLQESLRLNYTEIGATMMISNITSSIIQPCLGYFLDRFRIKWLLPISVVLTYIGFSLIGLAPSYGVLLALVCINGIGVAAFHPESFKIASYFTEDRKAFGMSLFQFGGNLGMALGPLLVVYAVQLASLRGTIFFLIPGMASLLLLIAAFQPQFILPPDNVGKIQSTVSTISAPAGRQRRWLSMTLLILAVSMRSWAHLGLITFAPFYYIHILHGESINAGKLVFAFLIGGAIGTLVGGVTADRVGHKLFFCASLLLSSPLIFLFSHVSGPWCFFIFFWVGFCLISSFSVTIVMGQTIFPDLLGMASGLMLGFVIGIGGLGAGLLGWVADTWGILSILNLTAIMPIAGTFPLLLITYPDKRPRRTN